VALLAATVLVAAGVPALGAGTSSPPAATGLTLVQYAETNAPPLPWDAHSLSGTTQELTITGSPAAAADATGGTQVAFANPTGSVVWLDGSQVAAFHHVDLTALLDVPKLAGEPVPAEIPVPDAAGTLRRTDAVFTVATSGHLIESTWTPSSAIFTHLGVRVPILERWQIADLTGVTGPPVWGTPTVVSNGSTIEVFAATKQDHLMEYVNDGLFGNTWNGYDLTEFAPGSPLVTDPVAFYDPIAKEVRVAAKEVTPNTGDVIVFTPNDAAGRIWSASDLTSATRTAPAANGPTAGGLAAGIVGGQVILASEAANGDLVQYAETETVSTVTTTTTTSPPAPPQTVVADSWKVTDLTAAVAGSPAITGTPSIAVSGTTVTVAAAAASWGDLFEWSSSAAKVAWTATDVSITGTGPTRTVSGSPSILSSGGVLSVFAAGLSVPAPEGTGVYAIPSNKWAQAVKDGWHVLGVTGGIGTQCSPWTSSSTLSKTDPPDEYVGQTIQSTHVRTTWLSFWTVSGPGTTPSSACGAEKGPVTQKTYYDHGFLAGAAVATEIDTYRAAGLGLKPDWVIFDPEGYPDNHSGLWGPTAPAAKLDRSVLDWYSILEGWHDGIASVDPTLKAGLYANQYEYETYRLSGQALPTFIAGAFAQNVVNGVKQLVVPTRSAFGSNIRGYVMYNTFNPTCAQVNNERLLLAGAPWNGAYNTVQTPAGTYCPPGATP
jgi:hypothetical protein